MAGETCLENPKYSLEKKEAIKLTRSVVVKLFLNIETYAAEI